MSSGLSTKSLIHHIFKQNVQLDIGKQEKSFASVVIGERTDFEVKDTRFANLAFAYISHVVFNLLEVWRQFRISFK